MNSRVVLYSLLAALVVLGVPLSAIADEADDESDENDEPIVVDEPDAEAEQPTEEEDEPTLPGQVEVIGEEPEDLESIPGSATVVDEEDLEARAPMSGNEVLERMPGVHVRDEEGIGLRPNIGIRGLDPSRSRTLLVLEDGVPISLAAYGEPEMYYSPSIDRMERLELVKGSGSIVFGPQTIGGVLNYITPDPPEELTVQGQLRGGTEGYMHGQASVGDTVGDFGYRLEAMHQRMQGHRNLNLDVTDVTGKFTYDIDSESDIGLKLQYYDEFSQSTYLGLTTAQFENNPDDNFAIHDELPVSRLAASATYTNVLGDSVLFEATAYGHRMTRPWNRQDFDRFDVEDRDYEYERVIDGQGRDVTDDPDAWPDDGSGIFFRNTFGARDRTFYVGGVEPRATIDYSLGDIDNELIVGTRVHGEMADEQRPITRLDDPDFEEIRDDETRRGFAVAGYGQNRFMLLDGDLEVSPGLRVESFWNSREVRRSMYEDHAPPNEESDHVLGVIPGIGAAYALTDEVTAFGGVHRGFAPPRTKDAVTTDGERLELDAEFSVNYELGVRTGVEDWLAGELTGFVLDFSNQIIPPAEAAGATAEDPEQKPLVNAGETLHYGIETDVAFDPATLADAGFGLPVSASYTFVLAEFGDEWEEEIAGNRVPYAPEHQFSGDVGLDLPVGLSTQLSGSYVSGQYTDPQNTDEPTADGLAGQIDPYFLIDARVGYTHEPWGTTLFVAGKNLTDETYIASRAPRGIQPGPPRRIFAGVQGEFGP